MTAPFFELISVSESDGQHTAAVRLNAEHPVYNGHFPDQPVAPGVMLMNMCREVAEKVRGEEVRIRSARSIKFVKVVDPRKIQDLVLTLKFVDGEGGTRFQCVAKAGEDTYFKIIATI